VEDATIGWGLLTAVNFAMTIEVDHWTARSSNASRKQALPGVVTTASSKRTMLATTRKLRFDRMLSSCFTWSNALLEKRMREKFIDFTR
jgi:hypothetical protein